MWLCGSQLTLSHLSAMNTRFEQLKLGLPLRSVSQIRAGKVTLFLTLYFFPRRPTRRQGNDSQSQEESSSPSFSGFLTRALIHSPKMFRRTVNSVGTEESPVSVSRGRARGRGRDSGKRTGVEGAATTVSAPNTPGSRRALLPR